MSYHVAAVFYYFAYGGNFDDEGRISDTHGKTEFIQLVGITEPEIQAIIEDPDNVPRLIARMKADGNEDLVTDMRRTKSYL